MFARLLKCILMWVSFLVISLVYSAMILTLVREQRFRHRQLDVGVVAEDTGVCLTYGQVDVGIVTNLRVG